MPAKRLDAKAFDSRIVTLDQQLAYRETEKTELCLKLAADPDSAEVHQMLTAVDREIAELAAKKGRMEVARQEALKRNNKATQQEYLQSLEGEIAQVRKIGGDIEDVAEQIIKQLEPIAGLLNRYETLATERGLLAYGVFCAARGFHPKGRNPWESFSEKARLRVGPLPVAIEAALWRSGLGRVGPSLGIDVTPPSRLVSEARKKEWIDPQADLPSLMRDWASKDTKSLEHGMRSAVELVADAFVGRGK